MTATITNFPWSHMPGYRNHRPVAPRAISCPMAMPGSWLSSPTSPSIDAPQQDGAFTAADLARMVQEHRNAAELNIQLKLIESQKPKIAEDLPTESPTTRSASFDTANEDPVPEYDESADSTLVLEEPELEPRPDPRPRTSLFDLPAEVLLQIFELIGKQYFQEYSKRLTVSKTWYQFAQSISLKSVNLSALKLINLGSNSKWPDVYPELQDNTRSFSLFTQGNVGWYGTDPIPAMAGIRMHSRSAEEIFWKSNDGKMSLQAFDTNINRSTRWVADLLSNARRLSSLKVEVLSEVNPHLRTVRQGYLQYSSLQPFLSIQNLSHLDLDLIGMAPQRSNGRSAASFHVCDHIAALLPTLVSLKLRLRTICSACLTLPEMDKPLSLKLVLVNLSMSNENSKIRTKADPDRCGVQKHWFNSLMKEIEVGAQDIVEKMVAPQSVKVFWRGVTLDADSELLYYDVITGKRGKVVNEAQSAWGAMNLEHLQEFSPEMQERYESLLSMEEGNYL